MRLLVAGIVQFLTVSAVFAQASGDIESLGFEHAYRPGCWTPMVVRLTPTSGSAFKGKIAVYQEDADHDHAIFTRPIALRGNAEGSGEKIQRFWMYFVPQPELLRDGPDPTAVNRKLQVFLTTEDGKQITRLPIRDNLEELDDWNRSRGTKLVLCIVEQSSPVFSPYAQLRATIGVKEPVDRVVIPISNAANLLPESVLGYEAVDAIVWCDADPGQLSKDQKTAIEEYVRRGGKLVVCQTGKPNVWEMVKRGLGQYLPVEVQAIEQTNDLTVLKRITEEQAAKGLVKDSKRWPKWKELGKGPYDIALAKPKPGAMVVETDGENGGGRPYLVRGEFGMGSVTWVAQDLGEGNLTARGSIAGLVGADEDYKWMYIWDRVLGWGNVSQPAGDDLMKQYTLVFGDTSPGTYHLNRSFLSGMEFPGTGAAYLGLAILFFIVYWMIAGPGSYLYLAGKKKPGMSWFAFALSALVATALTVTIVKLVLRGSAQIHHVSFVRMTPGEPAVVYTQFGLYIPRDGGQKVELKKTAADAVSYVTAYPSLVASEEGAPPIDYEVPVFEAQAVTFPYRSTLKKLQAKWVGELPQGVEGAGRLTTDGTRRIEGNLTNQTGRDLKRVFFIFQRPIPAGKTDDDVLYLPSWSAGATLNLGNEYKSAKKLSIATSPGDFASQAILWNTNYINVTGPWESTWFTNFDHDSNFDDHNLMPGNFPILSLYDRLLPVPKSFKSWDLHRPALRQLDISGSLAAGRLIILAETDPGPLPVPIEVEGDQVAGEGVTYYQFILPLNRSALNATTQPVQTNAKFKMQNAEQARRPLHSIVHSAF